MALLIFGGASIAFALEGCVVIVPSPLACEGICLVSKTVRGGVVSLYTFVFRKDLRWPFGHMSGMRVHVKCYATFRFLALQ